MKDQNQTVCIITCLKQEELYIKEWLDWHIKCGINHFYLCDNNDSNYIPKLQDVIQDYINKDIVTIFNYNDIWPIQSQCYTDIYDKIGNEYDWVLVIDIDEFICLPKYNNEIKKYLDIVPEYVKCIGINWRCYGDNELIKYDDRPVQERFKNPRKVNGQSRIVKSIIRGKQYFDYDRKIFHQHCAVHKNYTDIKENFYDVLFNKIYAVTNNNLAEPERNNINSEYFDKLYNTFYIKHYITKTIEEYVQKINRGTGTKHTKIKNKKEERYSYSIDKFFVFNNRTKEKEEYIEKVKKEIEKY